MIEARIRRLQPTRLPGIKSLLDPLVPRNHPHRRAWLDWLRRRTGDELDPGDVALTTVLAATLLPGSVAERRLVVDSFDCDGYHGFLIATYRDDALLSVVLDDDEGHVVMLDPEA
ncbi:MAG: hypothetical protein WD689_02390 [Gaiellaceae bacterium]